MFHFKNSFRSEDIWIFVLTFCSFRKNSLFRKLRLRLQSLYCPISHKVKAIIQWMKYGQVIEYNKRNIFLYTDWQISLRKTYKLHQIKPQRYPYYYSILTWKSFRNSNQQINSFVNFANSSCISSDSLIVILFIT